MRSLHVATFAAVVALAAIHPAAALTKADLKDKLETVLAVLKSEGAAGYGRLADPDLGILDLGGTGLHSWAFDSSKSTIVFDHSGQTEPGMDLSEFVLSDGRKALQVILDALAQGDGTLEYVNEIPHPTTYALGTSSLACAEFAPTQIVCVMAWLD